MTDSPPYYKSASPRDIDFGHYLRHYGALLWRWKVWVLCVAPTAALIVGAVLLHARKSVTFPSLPATVTLGGALGGEPNAGMVQVSKDATDEENDSPDTLAQTAMIRSRDFLRGVAEDLSLRLTVRKFPREAIFDSVAVDSQAPSGRYLFEVDKNGAAYAVFRKDSTVSLRRFFHKELAARGAMDSLKWLQLPGVHLRFTHYFQQHPHDFKFTVSNILETVESLRDSVSVHTSSTTAARQYPSFTITMTSSDYTLAAATVNMIADKFVARNIKMRQARSQSIREILTQQLEKAKSELAESEDNLRAFRTEHPTVGLSKSAEEMLSSSFEAGRADDSVEEAMNTAKMLQKRLAATPKQSLPQVCSEVLGFLTVQKDNGAPFLTGELSRLIAESHRLEGQYDNTHPIVVKNQAEIRQTIEKVTLELQNFIEELKQRETEQQTQISALSQKIHALPSEELNLSELTRLQQIKADIYARLLDKFYQSSVSDVTEIPDFYVMDYAAPPMPPPSGLDRKVLLMCFFFTLFVLFGPMVAVDFLSKTVRTEVELKKLLGVDILESIPRITLKKGASGRSPSNGLSNTLIINEENFAEDYVKELFRLLRTKIMFRLHGSAAARAIVISSLESNVGKSTIASNIAIAMAQQNLKTVLVDGDLRLGTIHHLFNLEKSPGLSEFLNNDRTDKPVPISIHHPGAIPNLSVITSGEYLANAGELVASDRMRSLIRTLTGKYDMVIFDSPPISIVADALTVDALFSHYLLVVRAGRTNVVDLREKIAEHAQLKSKLMGVVLNFASIDRKMHYYKQSKYYFQGQQKTGA